MLVGSFVLPLSAYAARPIGTVSTPAVADVLADDTTSLPKLVNQDAISQKDNSGASAQSAQSIVAVLTIFADPSPSTGASVSANPCSYVDCGTHAFITVKNLSSSNITVGRFGLPYGKTMTLGTWGNKSEHKGMWYNLEPYFIYYNGAYAGRISLSYGLNASELASLNAKIATYDKWSSTYPCSRFAKDVWNAATISEYDMSDGYPHTPKNLADYLKNHPVFKQFIAIGAPVPYNYDVYYAQGSTGTPKKSTVYYYH